jgi:hypothetical protein
MQLPDDEPMSEMDRQAQEEAMFAEETARVATLDTFGVALEADKDKAVRWRLPIEQRMIEDLRQNQGEPTRLGEVKGNAAMSAGRSRQPEHQRAPDNITKPALKQISARIKDMLFPTGERNGDLKPSPLPELSDPNAVLIDEDTGQPFTIAGPPDESGQPTQKPMTQADLRTRETQMAEKRAARMLQHLDDALQEGEYTTHGRAVIDDGCAYGTGVLEGPITKRVRQASYNKIMVDGKPIPQINVKEKTVDVFEHVDVWMFYPQPCRNIKEAEHAFVLKLMTPKQVRELAKQPGFDKKQVNRLLGMEPTLGSLNSGGHLVERDRILSPDLETMTGRYTMWKYRGPIPKDALIAAGMDVDPDDHLTVMEGEVWFSQGIVVKIVPNTDEYCDRLPFYVYNYEKDPSCVFGFSVAHELRNDQESVNQTWAAVRLNAIMSSAPQIGVMPGMMEPAEGKTDLTMTKPRIWLMKEDAKDIRQVLSMFEVQNHTGELMALYERAKANAVERVMLPQMQEGAPTNAARTASGLAMLMNAANVVQKDSAKQFDHEITLPAWSAWCRSYLLNGDDEEAKGDFNVIPKGESHLLVKDIQAQNVLMMTQLAADPRFAPYFDVYQLLELNLKTMSIPTTGLLRNKEEVEKELQAQQGQQDPALAVAQLRMEMEMKMMEGKMQMQQLQLQSDERDRLAQLAVADLKGELEVAKIAQTTQSQAERTQSAERVAQSQREIDELRLGTDTQLRAEELASKERKIQQELSAEAPNVKLA